MKIEFASISIMVSIIEELRLHKIDFHCMVDDLGQGTIWVEEVERVKAISRVA